MPHPLNDFFTPSDIASLSRQISLPALEADARQTADRVVKGLTIAPRRSLTEPCAVVLHYLLHTFIEYTTEIAKRRSIPNILVLRLEHDKVLDALVAFANSTWTVEQKEEFESCRCQQHSLPEVQLFYAFVSNDNILGNARQNGHLHMLVTTTFSIISEVAYNIIKNPEEAIRLGRNSKKRSKWPPSTSTFIPNNAQATAAAFQRWAQFVQHIAPLQALNLLACCCPSLDSAIAQSTDMLPLFVSPFSDLVNSIQKLKLGELNLSHKQALQQELKSFFLTLNEKWFNGLMVIAQTDAAVASTLASLYTMICNFLPLVDKCVHVARQGDVMKSRFGMIAVKIYSSISAIAPIPGSLHAVLSPYADHVNPGTDLGLLVLSIAFLRSQPKCTHIICQNTPEVTKTNFKFCAACQAVRYCSKTCQVADWKHHKPACKALKWMLPFALSYHAAGCLPSAEELERRMSSHIKEGNLTNEEASYLSQYVIGHRLQPGQHLCQGREPTYL